MRFPSVAGENLNRVHYDLPGDFAGDSTFVVVAFQRWQQGYVDTWLHVAEKLAAAHPTFFYYELPIIDEGYHLAAPLIDGGMRVGVRNPTARARTITLYIDKEPFRRALDIPDEETVYVFLLDDDGTVLWREVGPSTPEKAGALTEAVEAALA
jgi:hypothetical protein